MKKLRIAIVGCKNMGRKHLSCLQEHFADRVKISGILNSTFTSTQIAAQELGVRAFEGIQKINHKNTDAVIVATPTENHYETAKILLNKNFPLLVEKPFSETFEQCLELSKIAKDKKIPLLVGHTENYNPAVIMLRDGKNYDYPKESHTIAGKSVTESHIKLCENDVFIAMSDGAIY
ncbi:MAG: Gfo/Idh/MocA family oxidoreductase, partial [Alphaproteobacteria bacterium]|nr:Gfo/Idh/MocA family oxidoreductase [Alphaproteobacteria bacterium]